MSSMNSEMKNKELQQKRKFQPDGIIKAVKVITILFNDWSKTISKVFEQAFKIFATEIEIMEQLDNWENEGGSNES